MPACTGYTVSLHSGILSLLLVLYPGVWLPVSMITAVMNQQALPVIFSLYYFRSWHSAAWIVIQALIIGRYLLLTGNTLSPIIRKTATRTNLRIRHGSVVYETASETTTQASMCHWRQKPILLYYCVFWRGFGKWTARMRLSNVRSYHWAWRSNLKRWEDVIIKKLGSLRMNCMMSVFPIVLLIHQKFRDQRTMAELLRYLKLTADHPHNRQELISRYQ